jgi:hypothetical protein
LRPTATHTDTKVILLRCPDGKLHGGSMCIVCPSPATSSWNGHPVCAVCVKKVTIDLVYDARSDLFITIDPTAFKCVTGYCTHTLLECMVCINNHVICKHCYDKTDVCPKCRAEEYRETPSDIISQMVHVTEVCPIKGCTHLAVSSDIPDHLEECAYRNSKCDCCSDTVTFNSMPMHMTYQCVCSPYIRDIPPNKTLYVKMMQDDVKKNGIGFYKLIDAKNRNVFVFVMHDGEYTYVYAFGSESFTQDSVSIKVVINETVLFHVNVPMMSPTDKVPYRIKIVESKTPDAEFAYHTTHNEKSCNIDVKNSTDEDIIILCEDLATNYRLGQKIIFANGMQRIRCTIMDSKYSNGIMHITICAEDDELQTWVVRLNDDESTLIYDDDDRTTAEIERAYEDMTEEEQVALATRLSLM